MSGRVFRWGAILTFVPVVLALTGHADRIDAMITTWYVDDNTCPSSGNGSQANPFCSIQSAICAAAANDLVLVAPGTYAESIRMKPDVDVVSEMGPLVTTINASGKPCTESDYCTKRTGNQCSAVIFGSGHTGNTLLDGFTITGARGLVQTDWVAGGGVFVFSTATISNNIITNNSLSGPSPQGTDLRGAGVYVARGAPVISNNTISGNLAVPPPGVSGAPSYGYGGGIWLGFLSAATVRENVIEGNVAGNPNLAYSLASGGGMLIWTPGGTTSPRVDKNLIRNNTADSQGGGISLLSRVGTAAEARVTNNVIVGNVANFGGGVYTYFNKSSTINNTIARNNAFLGGGVYSGQSDPNFPVRITNNVIEGNTIQTFGTGGGIYTLDFSATFDPVIRNNDLWGNERGQCGGDRNDAGCIGVNGNFSADPRFVDPTGGDFRVDPNSPVLDRAHAADAPPDDMDGSPRGVDGDGTPNSPVAGDVDVGAFEFIPCVPSAEICDGADNDCDGTPDDGLGQTTCGFGECERTVENCAGGVPQTCTPGSPTAEVCDGLDNDCNAVADDMGQTTCGVGQCERTVQNCVGGVPQTCTPGSPTAEVCDGLDNDCNGAADDGLGQTTCGVGECQVTVQNCVGGTSRTCTPGSPTAEVCDGLDNDCNGIADDNLGQTTCGVGECQVTVQNCVGGTSQTCTPGSPSAEVCDGLDNDCSGAADDNLGQTTCGVGECQVTVDNCAGGTSQTCTPGTPSAEVCDGLDNDCNGSADEGLGQTTCGVGECQVTVENCAGGTSQTCTPGSPTAEVCDGLDNDCNGVADEGLGQTTCGVGECQVTVENCAGGTSQTCTPGSPSAEVCDGLDNDCNGLADDGFPDTDLDGMNDCLDPDDDNDGVLDGGDCAPLDDSAWGMPDEVSNVTLQGAGPTMVAFDMQDRGIGTRYWVISGLMGRALQAGGLLESFCAGDPAATSPWTDMRVAPPAGEAWFYIVYPSNVCGSGSRGPGRDGAGLGDVCEVGIVDFDEDGSPSNLDCDDTQAASAPFLTETCDGLDNDCNGVADDMGQTTCGVGECQVIVDNCAGGTPQTCTPGSPTAEVCDGLDNDCNGAADDNLGPITCGVGECRVTVASCVDGTPQTCTPGAPTPEICDGLDNDCNGFADDGLGEDCGGSRRGEPVDRPK